MYTHQFSGDAGNLESQKFCPKLGDHIVASIFESSKATRPPTQAISEYPLTELQFCGVETFSDDRAQIPSELKDYIANSKGIKDGVNIIKEQREAERDLEKRVKALAKELGSEDFADRVKAENEAKRLPPEAVKYLERIASTDDNPQVRLTASAVAANIKNAFLDRCVSQIQPLFLAFGELSNSTLDPSDRRLRRPLEECIKMSEKLTLTPSEIALARKFLQPFENDETSMRAFHCRMLKLTDTLKSAPAMCYAKHLCRSNDLSDRKAAADLISRYVAPTMSAGNRELINERIYELGGPALMPDELLQVLKQNQFKIEDRDFDDGFFNAQFADLTKAQLRSNTKALIREFSSPNLRDNNKAEDKAKALPVTAIPFLWSGLDSNNPDVVERTKRVISHINKNHVAKCKETLNELYEVRPIYPSTDSQEVREKYEKAIKIADKIDGKDLRLAWDLKVLPHNENDPALTLADVWAKVDTRFMYAKHLMWQDDKKLYPQVIELLEDAVKDPNWPAWTSTYIHIVDRLGDRQKLPTKLQDAYKRAKELELEYKSQRQ